MKQDDKGQTFYGKCLDFLRRPIFRTFANILSHGGTHFITLLIVLSITSYYGFFRDTENIAPHNVGIHVGWASSNNIPNYSPKDSIDNIHVHILLNSDSIKKKTEGEYHNGIIIEFDGEAYERIIVDSTFKNQFKDSVVISLYHDPYLNSYKTVYKYDTNPSDRVHNEDRIYINKGKASKDTIIDGNNIKAGQTIVEVHPVPSVNCQVHKKDSVIVISMIPVDFSVYTKQKTKNILYFYSNEIGPTNSPYYYYYFNIPPAKNAEIQSIDFQVSDPIVKETFGMKYTQGKNLQYNYIYPEPDAVSNGRIEYYSREKKENIKKNQGVIIQAVDVNALNEQNRKAFLYSVLVGTGFAFLLDIIIQLIRELRRLHREEE